MEYILVPLAFIALFGVTVYIYRPNGGGYQPRKSNKVPPLPHMKKESKK